MEPHPGTQMCTWSNELNASKIAAYVSKNEQRYSGFWFDSVENRYVVAIPKNMSVTQVLQELRKAAAPASSGEDPLVSRLSIEI
jgi:hypothetical protein